MRFLIAFLMSTTAFAESILLTPQNTVTFRGEVNDESVIKANIELFALNLLRGKQNYPIYLVLDTPGGSISSGLSFIQFAKTIPNLHTISIFAASMGSAIVESLPGQRLVAENGILMFHRAAGQFSGYFENGEVERRLYIAKKVVLSMEKTNAARMKMQLSDYKSLVKDEFWLDAEDSVIYRAADKVVDIQCSVNLVAKEEVVEVRMLFLSATIKFSACPLLRSPISFGTSDKSVYKAPTMSNYVRPKELITIQKEH